MKKAILFIVMYALVFTLPAQEYFQAGYLIQTGTDTVHGRLLYQGKTNNCSICFFQTGDGEAKKYSPQLTNAYGFTNGEVYRTKLIFTDENEQSYVFLQVLLDGKVSLYVYNDEFYRERFFIEKDSLGINELRIVEQHPENTNDVYKHKEYIGYLKYYLADTKTPLDIDHTKLSLKAINELISSYNSHFDVPVKSYPVKMKTDKRESPLKVRIGMGFMYTYGSYKDNMDYPVTLSDDYRRLKSPGVFFNLSFKFPFFFQGKFSANTGIGYQKLKYQVEYNWPFNESRLIDYSKESLYIPLNFVYELLKTKVTPYVNAGAVFVYSLNPVNNNKMSTVQENFAVYIYNDNFISHLTFQIGVGLMYNIGNHFYFDFNLNYSPYLLYSFSTLKYVRKNNGTESYDFDKVTVSSNQLISSLSINYSF